MIVVIIIGVLAAVAIVAYQKYVETSRETEAVGLLGSIRLKQEAYRMTFHQYANVSGVPSAGYTPGFSPMNGEPADFCPPGSSDPLCINWAKLGVRPDGPVRFRYATIAGSPNAQPQHFDFQAVPDHNGEYFWDNDAWFAALAVGYRKSKEDYVCFRTFSKQDRIVKEDSCSPPNP